MRSVPIISATALCLVATGAHAKDGELVVSLESRARAEVIDGQFRPNVAASDAALLLRNLLFVEYDAGPVRIGGELLDARVYFERRRSSVSTNEVNVVEPLQAYVMLEPSERVRLQAGRFTLNLGSRRLIARNNFRNTINGFTGVNATFGDDRLGGTLFLMAATARLPSDPESIRDNSVELDRDRGAPTLMGGLARATRGETMFETYAIRIVEHDKPDIQTRDRRFWTLGARAFRPQAERAFDYEIEAAGQSGRARASAEAADRIDRRVRAGLFHAHAGYTFAGGWRPRLAIGLDLASGDGRGASYTRFDPLFSSRGYDFGPTSLYGALTRSNIVSADARIDVRPNDRTEAHFSVRPLRLAAATDSFTVTGVRDPAGAAGKDAGVQLEGRVRYMLVPDRLRFEIGGGYLAKGQFLQDAANAPATGDTRFAYAELTATF